MSASGWRDQMTAVNGNGITYDNAGNPTEYYDGTELIWEGRELSGAWLSDGRMYSYTYNADGIRDSKQEIDLSLIHICFSRYLPIEQGRTEILFKIFCNQF